MSLTYLEPLRGSFLLIGDSSQVHCLRQALGEQGHQLSMASSEREALAQLDATSVDLILLDEEASNLDGYAVCRQLKGNQATCRIPVIFAGALGNRSDEAASFAAGAADYIAAPFDLNDALTRLEYHLALRKARRRAAASDETSQVRQESADGPGRRSEGCFNLDAEWRFTRADRQAERLLQRSRSSLVGRSLWDIFPCLTDLPFRAQRAQTATAQTEEGQQHEPAVFADYCPTAGRWFEFRCRSDRAGLTVYFRDVSEQGRFKTALGELVEIRTTQLQQMFDFNDLLKRITDAIRDSTDDAQILRTAIGELGKGLGLCYGSAALHTIDTLSDDGAAACEYVARDIENQSESQIEFRATPATQVVYPRLSECHAVQFCHQHPDGSWQLVLACPIVGSQGLLGDLWLFWPAERELDCITHQEVELVQHVADQCAIAIRQVHLHKTAQNQVEVLESLHQQKDDFLSAVSHELRSPVTNMKMAIQMLTMSLDKLQENAAPTGQPLSNPPPTAFPSSGQSSGGQSSGGQSSSDQAGAASLPPTVGKVQQYLQILSGECDREITLINDLLDLQRLDSGSQSPSFGLVSLESWLTGIVQSFEDRMRARQQQLQFRCLNPLMSFRTDVTAVHRILTELLDNAHKYTPSGETVLVTARMIDRALQIQVMNSGVEIPANHLPYIFDKFYRVRSNNLWQKGGTGLGLALVKQLTYQLEGTVQVYSQQGKTSFRLTIPESSPVPVESSPIA